jgi:DNA-binding SARP family transcriptional activator
MTRRFFSVAGRTFRPGALSLEHANRFSNEPCDGVAIPLLSKRARGQARWSGRMTAADHDFPAGGVPRLQIMGSLRLWRGDAELNAGPRKQRCLLALLLARAGRPISVSDLVELVWDQEPPASAVNAIHKYVGNLRRLLEPDLSPRDSGRYLLRHGDGYRFAAGVETLDLMAFRQSVAAAKSSLGRGDADEALRHYVAALRHCQGRAGSTLADSSGAAAIFARIDDEFLDAVVSAAEIAMQAGQPSQVLATLRLAAAMSPLNEPVQASLMTALAATGQQAEALAVFQAVRTSLAEELGIDPGAALRAAHQRVLSQAVPLAAAAGEGSDEPRGTTASLRSGPFARPAQLPPDLPNFVGRGKELAVLHDLVTGMRQTGRTSPLVVAMHGIGGVGKSTLATHFAHLVADKFPDGQLYLDLQQQLGADERISADDALHALLYSLSGNVPDMPGAFDARVGAYRSQTADKRILILLDNVQDLAQVRPLLPNSPQSLVLVTSRSPLVGLAALGGAHLLHVDLPSLPVARKLLERRLTGLPFRRMGNADLQVADEIIEWCGRLPLALVILAGLIAGHPGLSLTTVAAELRDGARRLAAFPDDFGISDPWAAFAWSDWELSPGAARLLRLLSVALPAGTSTEACASLSGQDLSYTRECRNP